MGKQFFGILVLGECIIAIERVLNFVIDLSHLNSRARGFKPFELSAVVNGRSLVNSVRQFPHTGGVTFD
jgi:hypothetical protein